MRQFSRAAAPQSLCLQAPLIQLMAGSPGGRGLPHLQKVCIVGSIACESLPFLLFSQLRRVQDGSIPCGSDCSCAHADWRTTAGNAAQSNTANKKPPAKITRNSSTRESNGAKPSSPTQRPSTSIDPLTRVWLPCLMFCIWMLYAI